MPLDSSALTRVSSGDPAWLARARSEAFELFQSLGMPAAGDELWKYVDLDFDLDEFTLAPVPRSAPGGYSDQTPGLAVVDGIGLGPGFASEGFLLEPLAAAFGRDGALAGRYDAAGTGHDKFSAAGRAFGGDGAFIEVSPRRAVEEPILVDLSATAAGSASFPRVMISLGDGAECSVAVDMTSDDGLNAVVVPEIDVDVGAAANLKLTILQRWGDATTSIARVRVTAGRDAGVTVAEAGLGGALSRVHLAVDLVGRGSSARIVGAYFGDHDQVLDYRYFMRHAGENTNSDMFLKGAVEDEALSVFTGLIRIEEEAQRSNAFQTNRNLLLSDAAAAQSVPNLEILANDVKCGHGSTVGPLDLDQRYYLMSRGLDGERADRLQVKGFFEEALARFPDQSVTGGLRSRINAKYIEAQEEGRL